MVQSNLNKGTAIFVAALFAATPASASDGASFSIFGRVPTMCQVSLASQTLPPLQTGGNNLGTLTELCNSVDGYTITLYHPAGLTDAWVDVGGTHVPISAMATQTVIVDSSTPAFRTRPLRLVLEGAPAANLAFSLDAQAKGMLF